RAAEGAGPLDRGVADPQAGDVGQAVAGSGEHGAIIAPARPRAGQGAASRSCTARRSSDISTSAGRGSGRVADVASVTLHVGWSPSTGTTTRPESSSKALSGRN